MLHERDTFAQKLFTLLVGILVVSIIVYLFGEGINGNDFWWHVKVGEYVAQAGTVPTQDIFFWIGIERGIPWTAHEWLAEVFFYHLFSKGGEIGIFLFSLASALLLVFLLWNEARADIKNNLPLGAVFFILLAPVVYSFFYGRPQLFSFFFLFAELKILFSWHEKRDNRIIVLPFVSALWSNVHGGSSCLSYVLCIIFLVSGAFDVKLGKITSNKLSNKDMAKLIAVTVLTALAILINPIGLKVFIYPFQNLSDKISMATISEWQPPDAKDPGMLILHFLPIFIMLLGFFSSEKRIELIDFLIMVFFVFAYLRSVRFIMLWYIAAVFCAFKYVPRCGIKQIKRKWERLLVYSAILAALIFLSGSSVRLVKKIHSGKLIRTVLGDEAIAVIKKDDPNRMYNDYNLGEALIYNDIPTFFDARADLFVHDNIMRDGMSLSFLTFIGNEKETDMTIEALISKYDFDSFAVLKQRPLFVYLYSHPEGYGLLYEDESMAYFIRIKN